MSKEKIAVDIDDVLASSTDAVRLFVNQRHSVELTEEHYRAEGQYWKYYESVWEQHGIEGAGLMKEYHDTVVKDQSDIRTLPGAVEVCKSLSQKYELYAVTSRTKEMEAETRAWITAHFGLLFKELIVIGFGQEAQQTKGQVCVERGIEYLIDDNIDHCLSAAAEGVTPILFGNYGWHQNIPVDMVRCKNWQAVEAYFYGK
jgi:5'(3')-deoxyribonucleotidase